MNSRDTAGVMFRVFEQLFSRS